TARRPLGAISEVGAVGFQLLLGVGEEALQPVEKVAGAGDAVGVVQHVPAQGAVDLRSRAEAAERPVRLKVGAEEVSADVELIPETQRLPRVFGGLRRAGGARGRVGA